jgi:hypothetical protein
MVLLEVTPSGTQIRKDIPSRERAGVDLGARLLGEPSGRINSNEPVLYAHKEDAYPPGNTVKHIQ